MTAINRILAVLLVLATFGFAGPTASTVNPVRIITADALPPVSSLRAGDFIMLKSKGPDGEIGDVFTKQGDVWVKQMSLMGPSMAGAKGDKGDTGAPGASVKGDKGDKGDTGTPGASIKGDKGDAGVSPTVTIGTVTTGAAGSQVAITNSGTAGAAVFNFAVPQGAPGAAGAAGVSGILTASSSQSMGLLALNANTSFTVAVPGATTSMVAVVGLQGTSLVSLGGIADAYVSAPNTVTINVRALVAIAAGTRTFQVRVIP